MTARRLATALLGAALGMLLLGAPAVAQYPPETGNGRVNRTVVKACQCVQFSGDGFAPGAVVTVRDNGRVVAVTEADNRGEFRVRVCFAATDQGTHELRGAGTSASGAPREVRAVVEVRGSACGRPDDETGGGTDVGSGGHGRPGTGARPLPRTGAAGTVPGLLTGFGLVTAGAAVVFLAHRSPGRNRRRRTGSRRVRGGQQEIGGLASHC